MNTSKLQAFAAGARVELMKAVRAKLDAAMEPNSAASVDNPRAFAKLQDEIRGNGGGEQGRARTAERHAYRWFNRIIALRYMDANDFTSPHVVSGEDADNPNALPAVLSAAKRGEFDENVFGSNVGAKAKLVPTITALLDGSKTSNDPQGEAYGLLLRAYCDCWHRFLPFMFDDAGAADEILMPADLLASDSVLRKVAEVMTVADCVGDEGQGNVEIIGWLYQFYIAERKDEVMAGFKKSKKAGAAEIPAATQLFTPDWIVRYLVQNTVGRLWTQSHPESQLYKNWEYYVSAPSDEGAVTRSVTGGETGAKTSLNIESPEDLTVCDPACGSGHMLTYAFDLLYDIYDEAGYSANEIPGLILEHNLFGMEIDERAANLAAFALTMKARGRYRRFFRKQVQPNIQRITPEYFTEIEVEELNEMYGVTFDADTWNTYQHADIYGSLIQPPSELKKLVAASAPSDRTSPLSKQSSGLFVGDVASDSELNNSSETERAYTLLASGIKERSHTVLTQTRYLTRQYAAVVANPPYLSSKNMDDELKSFIKKAYPDGRTDLFAAFILRNKMLVIDNAFIGMITMQGWMFLSAFYDLRKKLLSSSTIDSLLHLGSGAFDSIGGEIVSTVAFVVENKGSDRCGTYYRLVDIHGDLEQSSFLRDCVKHNTQNNTYHVKQSTFSKLPSSVIVYWLPASLLASFIKIAKGVSGEPLSDIANVAQGFTTGDNNIFLREWFECAFSNIDFNRVQWNEKQKGKWIPCDKGGEFRKWYGNNEFIVDWTNNGMKLLTFPFATPRNTDMTFAKSIACSYVASDNVSFRFHDGHYSFTGSAVCVRSARYLRSLHCYLNSSVAYELLKALSPTISFEAGQLRSLPFMLNDSFENQCRSLHDDLVDTSRSDWDSQEISWEFVRLKVLEGVDEALLSDIIPSYIAHCKTIAEEQRQREIKNNELVADAYGVRDEVPCDVPIERVSLKRNPAFCYPKNTPAERDELMTRDIVKEIISYAVGCMFGRYSLDKPGLILASQGETIDDYHAQIPNPTFEPDADNVIPVTDDEWFEDDIVARFRDFLSVACGEKHLNENIAYIEQVLGKPLRKYFATDFYDDHVSMYKNRPIYWMYSSRADKKGTFKALVYLHRYMPATTNTVLRYLREFTAKLSSQSEALLASGKPAEVRKGEKLHTAIKECTDYERDVLYPLATRNLPINLDDGVLVNYLRLGPALRAIPAIEKKRPTVQSWTWPTHPLED
ncbi:BREX-1 system adenine-specific DNA-methyltransferase PglX [Bifidobacterium biavatii]|uniref:site-specific DNA-methyltransferase (adenine-specific) n=1 Tax=Bifidobacterium biavatii DSM 23969 TaxID=1437608 RepID=A0A087A0K2_9BIFI|nr:BREX-1 system adenine-specific DNA-methyltransferase PglX [Bifidobacterium biavatii]KFI52302.1 type II restriction endonuclease [Bifidobacterium biavatii DSM 23969]